MKRSEMVHLISDNVLSSLFPNMNLEKKNLMADMILTEIEKYGMQPPNITKMPNEWFRSTGDYGYEAAEWEEE